MILPAIISDNQLFKNKKKLKNGHWTENAQFFFPYLIIPTIEWMIIFGFLLSPLRKSTGDEDNDA